MTTRLRSNNTSPRRQQGCWPSSSLCWWLTLLLQCVIGIGGQERRLGQPFLRVVSEPTTRREHPCAKDEEQSGEQPRIQPRTLAEKDDYQLIQLVHSGNFIQINRYIDGTGMQRCITNLNASDVNGDGKLSRTEYTEFVQLESNGTIDEETFSALGPSFISLYYAVACNQCYDNTQNETCCVGDNAFVQLPSSDDDTMDQMLIFLCSSVEEAIADATTPTLAPATTNNPTRLPAPITEAPSQSNGAVPSTTPNQIAPSLATPIPTTPTTSIPTATPSTVSPSSPANSPTIQAIRIPTSSPTRSNTTSSTEAPSPPPTSGTNAPSPPPTSGTSAPTSQPTSGTLIPTSQPTSATGVPSPQPTSGTRAPSPQPTSSRTGTPSPEPTHAPTSTVVVPPTSSPTINTLVPTTMPPSPVPTVVTVSPSTSAPTIRSTTTTIAPTMSPSLASNTSSTLSPTAENNNATNVLCVEFFFSLQNRANLTANDILLGVNNSLRIGLEEAAANVTIAILNASFPRSNDNSSSKSSSSMTARQIATNVYRTFSESDNQTFQLLQQPQTTYSLGGGTIFGHSLMGHESRYTGRLERMVCGALSYDLGNTSLTNDVLDTFLSTLYSIKVNDDASHRLGTNGRSHRSRFLQSWSHPRRTRRLVYYSDVLPPNVTNVVDDPFCPKEDNMTDIQCAIVSTDVCVFLEEGDDAQAIEQALSDGFRDAVRNGTFFDAIPPEYLPQ